MDRVVGMMVYFDVYVKSSCQLKKKIYLDINFVVQIDSFCFFYLFEIEDNGYK